MNQLKVNRQIMLPKDSAKKFMRLKISQLYFVKYKNTGFLWRENMYYEKLRLAIQNMKYLHKSYIHFVFIIK